MFLAETRRWCLVGGKGLPAGAAPVGYTLDNVDPKFLLLPRYESGNLKLHLPQVMDCTCSTLHYFPVVMWSQINPYCLKLLLSCPCSKRKRNTIEGNSQRNLEGTPHCCNQPLQLATVPTSWRYRNKCRKWLVLSLTFGLSWTAPVEAPVPSVSLLALCGVPWSISLENCSTELLWLLLLYSLFAFYRLMFTSC